MIGIPEGWRKLRGARINRRGNNPQREKAPPLKALNDPANLEEGTPEIIKKAAEVKMAEDAKKQKIKAIKYLTSIGCACYDIDDSITKALIGASEDCTEDVRLATLNAIKEAAEKQCCKNCGSSCCCKEDLVMRLAEMAYERDDTGCYLEPSKRVREAAKEALMICCPDTGPVQETDETPERERETVPTDDEIRETFDEDAELLEQGIDDPGTDGNATVDSYQRLPVVEGVVMELDRQLRIAHVHFQDSQTQFPVGTKLMAVVERQGQRHWLGPLTVYKSFAGSAHVTAPHELAWNDIQQGTPVVSTMQVANLARSIRNTSNVAPVVPMMAARPAPATPNSGATSRTNSHILAPVFPAPRLNRR